MATSFYDTFTDQNGTFITSHNPDVGNEWFQDGGVDEYRILSNKLGTINSNDLVAFTNKLTDNSVQHNISFNLEGELSCTLYFDYEDDASKNTKLSCFRNSGTLFVDLIVNGSLVGQTSVSASSTHKIEVIIDDSSGIDVKIDSNLLIENINNAFLSHSFFGVNLGTTNTTIDNLKLETITLQDTNNNISLFLKARAPHSDNIPLYTAGNFNQANIPLYTQGGFPSSGSIPLFTVAEIGSGNANIPLYTEGKGHPIPSADSQITNIPLFIDGIGRDNANMPLFLRVKEVGLSNDNITLYQVGSEPGTVQGYDTIPLYIADNADPFAKMPLYTEGFRVNRSLNNDAPLYVKGGEVNSVNSGIPLHLFNQQDTITDNFPLFIFSTEPTPVSSSVPMYIDAHGKKTSTIELYTNGF